MSGKSDEEAITRSRKTVKTKNRDKESFCTLDKNNYIEYINLNLLKTFHISHYISSTGVFAAVKLTHTVSICIWFGKYTISQIWYALYRLKRHGYNVLFCHM